ncbi:hypothetical protein ZIOFF_043640 [Zingiber officinale]|uniref:Deoxyuridine 5'-triphosphate nucleotidohydrolase n=1 Tax=Zingiber officinale TaxID=94328 RepID=A0A8J5GAX7_ZINOF|nr:hypothetical protein ZIOFF_043640 [Zingiber officinale]
MVGRLSNTPNVGFAYEVQGVVDYLISNGVRALPERRYSTTALQGLNWVIRPTQVLIPMQPSQNSEEDPELEASPLEDDFPAILRASLDFNGDKPGNSLGTYGRIATRSSATYKLGLDVRARVIASDYRGEIKILLFNHSDWTVYIQQGDCVAQIIFENIILPDILPAPKLSNTQRGADGFGLTNNPTIFDLLLPKEKHAISVLLQEAFPLNALMENLAGTTSP